MEDFFDNELVARFEDMLENNEEAFFDCEEYDSIVTYYLEIGDYEYANLALDFALGLYPNSVDMKLRRLETCLETGSNRRARELIAELMELAQYDLDFMICHAKYYSNVGCPLVAIYICEMALEKGEDQDFIHCFIADEYKSLQDMNKALEHYEKALLFCPEDDYALGEVMSCYRAMGRSEEALQFLEAHLDVNPFSEEAWNLYALLHFEKKNYKEAIGGFDYLLAINQEALSAYSNKASCYEAMNLWENALETYCESLPYEFTKFYSYYRIGRCYMHMELPIPALSAFKKSLEEDPRFHPSMIAISELHEKRDNLQEAIYFAREAAKIDEDNTHLQKRLAFLYINTGCFEEALIHFRKLVSSEPDHFYNWYAYVETLMFIGEYSDAEKILKQAIDLHPRAELYYQFSNCYFNLKNERKGMAFLSKAQKTGPALMKEMQSKYPLIRQRQQKEKTPPKAGS